MKQVLILLAASILIYSCQKPQPVNDNSQKNPACRVVTFTWSSSRDTFHISYNNSGKISKVSDEESVSNFEYAGNMITKTRFESGVLKERKIITTNAAGLATNIRTEDIAGASWHNEAYQYNGEEVSSATLTYSGSSYTDYISYTWLNHNMVAVKNNHADGVLAFEYYTDKPRQDGDFLGSINMLLQGYEVFRCRNLLKSVGGVDYKYDFDTAGKIIAVHYKESSNSPDTYQQYEYECK